MFQQGGDCICLTLCTFWNMKDLGLCLPWCPVRIGNVWASAGWKCTPNPAVNSRTTSSQAIIYRCCTSCSTVALVYPNLALCLAVLPGRRRRWLSHPVHMLTLLLAVVPWLSPASLLLLASLCLRGRHSQLHPSKLTASFGSLFSFSYLSDPTNLVSVLTDGYYWDQS